MSSKNHEAYSSEQWIRVGMAAQRYFKLNPRVEIVFAPPNTCSLFVRPPDDVSYMMDNPPIRSLPEEIRLKTYKLGTELEVLVGYSEIHNILAISAITKNKKKMNNNTTRLYPDRALLSLSSARDLIEHNLKGRTITNLELGEDYLEITTDNELTLVFTGLTGIVELLKTDNE